MTKGWTSWGGEVSLVGDESAGFELTISVDPTDLTEAGAPRTLTARLTPDEVREIGNYIMEEVGVPVPMPEERD